MRAIGLNEPWAQLIAEGKKTIETRRWSTQHRGWLLICATRGPKVDCRKCSDSWRASLTGICWDKAGTICQAPYGCAVAIVRLVNVRPMSKADELAAQCELYERAQAWELMDLHVIPPARRFPVRCMQRLFNVVIPSNLLHDLGYRFDSNGEMHDETLG